MKFSKLQWLLTIYFVFGYLGLSASPSYPGLVTFVQPDGSKISIYLKGDERVKWAETQDGYSLLFNSLGFYEYAVQNGQGDMVPSGRSARNFTDRNPGDTSFLQTITRHLRYSKSQIGISTQIGEIALKQGLLLKSFPTTGSGRLLCILMGFADKAFTKTQADFDNLFNQIGYSVNGATGSVHDFFYESSYNQLNLSVTIAGPYTAANNLVYYGGNDSNGKDLRAKELITEAVKAADPDVNYANFDNDHDGTVDGVYVIYAGYGEEAGGSPNDIWAHASSIPTLTLDGKTVSRYSCSSELSGTSGTSITNIGVICHEYGHILGAPDFYDTNYETDGEYPGTGSWDLQSYGMWNNAGKTPAHPNAYTKCYIYNWATATDLITMASPITINCSAIQNTGSFYRINTTTANEYFLLENRQQVGFDYRLPYHGLLVYHVDGTYIAAHSGTINAGSHEGMFIVPAKSASGNGVSLYDRSYVDTNSCPFPGLSGNTSFTDATTPQSNSWAGASTKIPITGISENLANKTVTFNFSFNNCTPPTTQASGISFSTISENSMTVNWTRGNGTAVMVVARNAEDDNTNPLDGNSYVANNNFGSGDKIGNNNFVVYNGTGTSVNVTNLLKGVTYSFSVYEVTSISSCYKTPALSGSQKTPLFCDSYGSLAFASAITKVVLNSINNVSGKETAYHDYTAISTTVFKNSAYPLTVNLATDGSYTYAAAVWIDWNQNNSFSDPGEMYNLGTAYNTGNGQTDNSHTSLSPLTITVPASALSGPTRMRVSCQQNYTPGPCDTGFDGEVEDYTLIVAPPVTWTGATDTDWNKNTNWLENNLPVTNSDVTIPSVGITNFPVVSGTAASCSKLTIKSGARLTIADNGKLAVSSTLTNSAGNSALVIQSSGTNTGSLINGTAGVGATVERYVLGDIWHLISPAAIGGQTVAAFVGAAQNANLIARNATNYALSPYLEATGLWDYYKVSGSNTSGQFGTPGKGYQVLRATGSGTGNGTSGGNGTISFKGTLAASDQDIVVTKSGDGWNLIGNPYPCALDIDAFLALNSALIDPSYKFAYVSKVDDVKSFGYDPASGIKLSSGEGFFLKTITGGGTVHFTTAMKGLNSDAFKSGTTGPPSIQLTADDGYGKRATTVQFVQGSTTGLDPGQDAGLFKNGDPSFSLFTRLIDDNGVDFAIQVLPDNNYENMVVPVGVIAEKGSTITFKAVVSNFASNYRAYLEDKATGTFTSLDNPGSFYSVTPTTKLSGIGRFYLHMNQIISAVEETPLGALKVVPLPKQHIVRIIGEIGLPARAMVYDMGGKLVTTAMLSDSNQNDVPLTIQVTGVYVIRIQSDKTPVTQKFNWR